MDTEWSDAWAVMSDPVKFASRFNAAVPGSHRAVTPDDIRALAHCGLIGRHGFFDRTDMETVRGILQYEKVRNTRFERSTGVYSQTILGEADGICETEQYTDRVRCQSANGAPVVKRKAARF
jgi:hypothetical protein